MRRLATTLMGKLCSRVHLQFWMLHFLRIMITFSRSGGVGRRARNNVTYYKRDAACAWVAAVACQRR